MVFNAVGERNVKILRGVRRVLRRRIKDIILQLLRVIVEHKRNVAAILPRTVSNPLGLV